jgi:tetratricopeptide (TPR) repeat protein
MIHNNSSQDAVFNVLYGLKSQIGRVEIALQQGTRPSSGPTGSSQDADGNQVTRNLRQWVRVAEAFHSNASAITREGPRSTVWGGSVLGDPLTKEQFSNIETWIPPPNNSQGGTTSSTVVDPSYHSDSDDDIDKALLKRLRELAVESRQQGDYVKAENFYRKVINRSKAGESNYDPQDLVQDRINLAYACLHQKKWADAEAIILPIAMERKLADIAVYVGLHALALAHLHGSDFEKADQCCKRALWGKRKTLGKENSSSWETLALLSRICEARGETEEAEAHRTFIPASYQPVLHLDPLVYLGRHGKTELQPQPTAPQTPSPSTTQVSHSPDLIVGVHFGAVQTAVSFAFATSATVEEAVISSWRDGKGTKIAPTACLNSSWTEWLRIRFQRPKLTRHRFLAFSTTTAPCPPRM